jgi:hypothetical protein
MKLDHAKYVPKSVSARSCRRRYAQVSRHDAGRGPSGLIIRGLTVMPGAVQHTSTATRSAVNASDKLPPTR